jgi:hypothetical protein
MASSVLETVVSAREFFKLDFWKGPKPTPETVYLVALVADERIFRVAAAALERWTRAQGVRGHL